MHIVVILIKCLCSNTGLSRLFGCPEVGVAVESALATKHADRLRVLSEVNARRRSGKGEYRRPKIRAQKSRNRCPIFVMRCICKCLLVHCQPFVGNCSSIYASIET